MSEKKESVPEATAINERKATTPLTAMPQQKETVLKAASAKQAETGLLADFTDKFCDKIASLKFIPNFITKGCAERKRDAKK